MHWNALGERSAMLRRRRLISASSASAAQRYATQGDDRAFAETLLLAKTNVR